MNFEFVEQLQTYEQVILLLVGLGLLFFGYRIKKAAFFVIWFILGYTLVGFLMPMISNWLPEVAKTQLYQILLPIGGGLLLALLGFTIEKVCIGGICFVLTMLITVQYFGAGVQTLAIGGVIGVIASAAAVALIKPATIIATSVAGGYALALGLLALCPSLDRGLLYFPIIGGSAAVGTIIQFLFTAKRGK